MGLEAVRLLVLDHDGVLTDNHVYTNQHGEEMCRYYRGDGIGIERVKAFGVTVACLASEVNPVVAARCAKLKIECVQGVKDKRANLETMGYYWRGGMPPLAEVAYVGNDINDLECLKAVGFPFVPADAECIIQRLADYTSSAKCEPGWWDVRYRYGDFYGLSERGGYGCVREVCDLIADAKEAARVHD